MDHLAGRGRTWPFAAVLALTPAQRGVFAALSREADILIRADRDEAPGPVADR